MLDLLTLTLSGDQLANPGGENTTLRWHWLGEGILELCPQQDYRQAVVLSAGIHGNETAPIEILNQLVNELLSGQRQLAVRLLILFGNPAAIRAGKRYLEHDINRMFGGRYQQFPPCLERERAQRLERAVADFFCTEGTQQRLHYDLHTAIRGSYHSRFGLLPYQTRPYSTDLYRWCQDIELDALVMHTTAGGTFAHYSSEHWSADSCTLELGKARPFGTNDLAQFTGIIGGLQALVSGESLPTRTLTTPMVLYRVVTSIIKKDANFRLHVADETLNFTRFVHGRLLAEQSGEEYRVAHPYEWILFPNPHVAQGLRAGMMLVKMEAQTLLRQTRDGVVMMQETESIDANKAVRRTSPGIG
ncbi:succinylglutamate desuccinylase [Yersinia ruckeri]|uniref:succinylglutamate desuccinylase n=1 Tax=Yersinia ruckeri TaxID=29486 RepID=UPI0005ACADA5|nr:succinylglutamate desuccinylase [Yersinia ruckeri]AJI96000.1 succinylglutamate desuccinylase [Yersinia ruckeri]MCW6568629.1 succinylglutamate desuccinylase [Yersinia ruckeri]